MLKEVDLWGYTIKANGQIIGLNGKEMVKKKEIKIKWGINGKPKFVSYARLVYYAFNHKNFNFNDKTIVIRQKNGNKDDYSIDNLIAVERKKYSQGENSVSAKLTDKQVEEIKSIYNLHKNQRTYQNDPMAKISYRKLAERYGVSHTMIMGIIKGTLRNKENYKM